MFNGKDKYKLTTDDKIRIANNIIAKNGYGRLSEELAFVENYVTENPPDIYETSSDDKFDFDYSAISGVYPQDVRREYVGDQSKEVPLEKVPAFVSGLNESESFPYKAVYKKTGDEGNEGVDWGFTKKVDRYQKVYNPYKPTEPTFQNGVEKRMGGYVYQRFYEDGTYDVVPEDEFNKKKDFNRLPDFIKEKYTKVIDEDAMSRENIELSRMYVDRFREQKKR